MTKQVEVTQISFSEWAKKLKNQGKKPNMPRSEWLPNCKFAGPCEFKTSYGGKKKCVWNGKCNQQEW